MLAGGTVGRNGGEQIAKSPTVNELRSVEYPSIQADRGPEKRNSRIGQEGAHLPKYTVVPMIFKDFLSPGSPAERQEL